MKKKKCDSCVKKHSRAIVNVIASVTAISGVVLICFWPSFFDYIFFKQLALKPGSKSFDFWSSPPQPLYLDIYLFNWTNPQDFRNKSTKPIFQEIGPFRFQEFPTKVNVTFHDTNSTVSYRKASKYIFVPDESRGNLNDNITSINVVALAAASRAKHWGFLGSRAISMGLTFYDSKIHITKTAAEWLFDGFEDQLINLAKSNPLLTDIPNMFDKFGWFYKKNNTDFLLGDFNVHTGVDDISQIGKIKEWNFESETSFFPEKCAKLTGSAGDFFTPHIKRDQILELFSPEMCRSIPMELQEELTIHGVNTLKFSGADRAVDNGTLYPENECFCGGECVPSGVFNVSSCRYGTPVFMSFPHFYQADKYYTDQIEGMKPDKARHEFFMSFEPKTAIPLEVAARFQINLLIEPISSVALYRDIPRKFMPVIWFEQHVKMSESIADEIKLALSIPLYGQVCGAVVLSLGVILFLIFPLRIVLRNVCGAKKRHRKVKDVDMNGNILLTETKVVDEQPETKKLINKEALYGIGVK